MKTLFLLGIFAALTVIAIKKPNQTAWDVVQELASTGKTTTSTVGPGKMEGPAGGTPASKKPGDSWKDVERTVATLRNKAQDIQSAAADAETETEPAPPPPHPQEEVTQLPEIPQLPENRVKTGSVDDLPVPSPPKIEANEETGQVTATSRRFTRTRAVCWTRSNDIPLASVRIRRHRPDPGGNDRSAVLADGGPARTGRRPKRLGKGQDRATKKQGRRRGRPR